MGYRSATSLADLYAFARLHPDSWDEIFRRLRDILNAFGRYARPVDRSAVKNAYWHKTLTRLYEVRETARTRMWPEDHELNQILMVRMSHGIKTGLMAFLESDVEPAVNRLVQKTQTFSLIHGDYCFSNILCDLPGGHVTLIDPRGSFGGLTGIYGAPLYDVAKLYHSVYGLYDLIVNDLFEVIHDGVPTVEISPPPDTTTSANDSTRRSSSVRGSTDATRCS